MWCQLGHTELRCILLNNMPDDLLCHTVAPGSSGSANTQKQFSTRNSSCIHPFINSVLDPVWDRNSSDVPPLANQIILFSENEFRIQYNFFANGVGSVFDSFDYALHGRAPYGFGGLHDGGNGILQKIKPFGVIKGYNLDAIGNIYSDEIL